RLQLRERFREDLSVLRLHSDKGGEFSLDLLRDFCRGEDILQSFTLPASPQQNGVAECRIGLVMEVARTSMIHAVAPYFLWPFAARPSAAKHSLSQTSRIPLPRRPFFVPPPSSSLPPLNSVLRQVLSLPSSTGLTPILLCPPPDQTQPLLQTDSPLPAPSPYAEQTDSLTKRREPESCPALPVRAVRTGRRAPPPCPPPVPGTHVMALRPSSVPLRIPLPSPPTSSLPEFHDPESELVHATIPTAPRLPATVVTDPSFESTAAGECALGTYVLVDRQEDFECLAAAVPHLMAILLAPKGHPDAPGIPTPRSYEEAITSPYSSQWHTAMDAEMASWKSTGTYVDAVTPPWANIVDGMWIFRVKRPPGSPPVFKARYVVRGFSQRQGVDFFHTFSPTTKMTTLRVLLHVAAQSDYELHSLDFSTAFLQGSLHEEIWLGRPPGFTRSFPSGTKWSL
ncbi:unnamed protein product, partial [Closterium sp. NIES-54]